MKKGKQKKEKTKTAAVVGSMSLSELQELCRTLMLEKEVNFYYTIRFVGDFVVCCIIRA